ncbi:hypothetical protein DVS28_a3678 [Euzebya pacifica]|uniref:Uncharacterized protein n=1 Tax=Euzebya pacifica TaxID=1608957 RepID=A0A346Y1K4_9ACTN|nr:hypothetical protein [Euzebya pacifica]AXV08351.1 hypothetical protein DVS28_a3678 [Euzebya pacifica]
MRSTLIRSLVLMLLLTACGGGEDLDVAGTATSVPATSEPAPATETTAPEATAAAGTDAEPTDAEPTDAEPTDAEVPTEPIEPADDRGATLVLDGDGLPAGDYTVVVEAAGQPVASTVRFDGGQVTVTLDATTPEDVSRVDVHAGPSADGPALLSGTVADGTGTIEPAVPVDLSGASGQYILATPTNGSDSDERSGIWYVLIPRAPGLVLPALPAEWVYEGWVTIDGVDVTTGRFGDPATPDDFDGFSGDQGGPPLPGEDFLLSPPEGLSFPVDLAGMTTFVTLEPAVDPDPAPSGLTVLSGQIPADAIDHTVYDMASTVDALPSYTAQVS